jgi:hypothetical protein
MEKLYVSTKELSVRWDMSIYTLRQWRLIGKGPQPCNITRSVKYRIEEVEEYERKAGFKWEKRKKLTSE